MYLGVDGCPGGWFVVSYDNHGYDHAERFDHIEDVWQAYGETAQTILIDVPIGLREDSNKKRPCDTTAREKLSPKRHTSVFPQPVRAAVQADSYEEAKEIQEDRTTGSLGTQSWSIADKIDQLDRYLREGNPEAKEKIRESHPEVCFWALNNGDAMSYSKTSQPAAAFWERVEVLKDVDRQILDHLAEASRELDAKVGNDDVVDSFVLALTASPHTGELKVLPAEWPDDDIGDPTDELPMEIVYAFN